MTSCSACHSPLPETARFCSRCGGAVQQTPEPATAGAASPAAVQTSWILPDGRAVWQDALPGPYSRIPVELLAVCALLAFAGAFVLWPVGKVLPDLLAGLNDGEFIRDLALLLLAVWVVLAMFAIGCLILSWRLAHADRVGRGLTYVTAGALGFSILIGNDHSTQLVLTMVACFGSIAVLALAPRVREFFVGPNTRQYVQPAPIVTARILLAVWALTLLFIGAMFVPLGAIADKYVTAGAMFLVIGIAAFVLNKRLEAGDPVARLLLSLAAVAYVVLLLVVGRRDPGLILPLSVSLGSLFFLWFPAESREYFAEGARRHPLPSWMTAQPVVAPPQAPSAPAPGPDASAAPTPAVNAGVSQTPTATATARNTMTMPNAPATSSRACRKAGCVAFGVSAGDKFCQQCGSATEFQG